MYYLVVLNTIIFSAFIIYSILFKKHLFYLPSFLFILFFTFRVQFAGVFSYDILQQNIRTIFPYFIIVYVFPFIFFINYFIFSSSTKKIYYSSSFFSPVKRINKKLFVLFTLILICLILYLSEVSFTDTGLYKFFTNPSDLKISRELSFKLIDSTTIRYTFSFLRSCIIPIFIVLICYKLCFVSVSSISYFFLVALLVFSSLITFLPGNRASLLYIFILINTFFYFKNRIKFNFFYLSLQILLFLLLPVLIVLRLNNVELSITNLVFFWNYGVYERLFVSPGLKVGNWWLDYSLQNGHVGIAGIPKIATLFGIKSLNMPNIIGLNYIPNAIESISASCCQLFTFFTYFGYPGLILCILFFLLLDFIVLRTYKLLRPSLYPILGSLIFLIMIHSTETELLTILITHGLIPTLIIIYLLNYRYKF